jgi:chromosome segregation ATPase
LETNLEERGALISSLEAHGENLSREVRAGEDRVSELSAHVGNVEVDLLSRVSRIASLEEHAKDLSQEVDSRIERIRQLELHAANLEELANGAKDHGRNLEHLLEEERRHTGYLDSGLAAQSVELTSLRSRTVELEGSVNQLVADLESEREHEAALKRTSESRFYRALSRLGLLGPRE